MSAIDTVTEIYRLFSEQDLDGVLALTHDDVTVDQDDRLPWGGHHVGRDGVATFAITLASTIESKLAIESLFEASGKVIQAGRTQGTVVANGRPFDLAEVHIWTVRDGKVAAAEFMIDTPGMLAALGPG
jgi:ketosteroid isomerase-like protein